MNDLKIILQDLYNLINLNLSIFDVDGKLIISYPEQNSKFCSMIKSSEQGMTACLKCDKYAFKTAKEKGEIYIYRCHAGLYEACIPLYSFNELAGFFMVGQTYSQKPFSQDDLVALSQRLSIPEDQLIQYIHEIPSHPTEQLISFANIASICASYISLTNRIDLKSDNLAYSVKKYIQNNYMNPITIKSLCKYFFSSKSTIINSFKKEYHISIHQYILDYRIEQSKKYLANINYSITTISQLCGFGDANYFTKAFKKRIGMTPSEYRERIILQNNLGE